MTEHPLKYEGVFVTKGYIMSDTIKLKSVVLEDFVNYKKPSMFLGTCTCTFKCCTEKGYDVSICQNSSLANQSSKDIDISYLYDKYSNSKITKAIVIGGLEPFLQFDEVKSLIKYFRDRGCQDDFVIYTGYTELEIKSSVLWKSIYDFDNIVIKYGRYVQGDKPHYDEELGVYLVSDNQYAKRY